MEGLTRSSVVHFGGTRRDEIRQNAPTYDSFPKYSVGDRIIAIINSANGLSPIEQNGAECEVGKEFYIHSIGNGKSSLLGHLYGVSPNKVKNEHEILWYIRSVNCTKKNDRKVKVFKKDGQRM